MALSSNYFSESVTRCDLKSFVLKIAMGPIASTSTTANPNSTIIDNASHKHFMTLLYGSKFDIEYDVRLRNPLPVLAARIDKFNHPGPTEAGEYYVHSVCGEVTASIRGKWVKRYLVRWTGWEDKYNTIEPLYIIGETAAYFCFKHPNLEIGIGAYKPSLVRRLVDFNNVNDDKILMDNTQENNFNGYYMNELKQTLHAEEKKKNFSKLVGFYGYYI